MRGRARFLCAAVVAIGALSIPPTYGEEPDATEVEAVATVLDQLHAAAAAADGARYFALFAPDAVFLGTDGAERWTLAQFREAFQPYFDRGTGWTYRSRDRHVQLGPHGRVAWFDEALDNDAYGACRGSGVLRRHDGAWRIAQYNLSIPIPNELARDVVARIRAVRAPSAYTTLYVVRHAEKQAGADPGLTDAGTARAQRLQRMLRTVPLRAVYHTQYRRTKETAAPTAAAQELTPTVYKAEETAGLAQRLAENHASDCVLVVGHSNTLPALLRALGVERPIAIAEDAYDNLLVVTLCADRSAHLEHLHFGD